MFQKVILFALILITFHVQAEAQSEYKKPNKPSQEAANMIYKEGYSKYSKVGTRYIKCISVGRIDGQAKIKEKGKYPEIAKKMNMEGDVEVKVTINTEGRVIDSKALSGPLIFRLSAEEAAKKWVYHPSFVIEACGCNTKVQPVQIIGKILFQYKIHD